MSTTITINMNNAALRNPRLQSRTELEKASRRHSMMADSSLTATGSTPTVQQLRDQNGPAPAGLLKTAVTV